MSEKVLPVENSDYTLPGRAAESDAAYYIVPSEPKPKSRVLIIATIAFILISAGVFSYYFVNQSEIDSQIISNTLTTAEERMAAKYNVGEFGSDHAHAVIAVFIKGEKINFGLPQFQLQSKYIHFENHNSYEIHKHATGVPLAMLFSSLGLGITKDCITLGTDDAISDQKFCTDEQNSLIFMINGTAVSDILSYEINHNDRILISFGSEKLYSVQLGYLASLDVHDVPEKIPYGSDRDISL